MYILHNSCEFCCIRLADNFSHWKKIFFMPLSTCNEIYFVSVYLCYLFFIYNIVMCKGYAWRQWRVLFRMIGFIDTSVTSYLNYNQYNSYLQSIQPYRSFTHFQFTVAHALGFSISTSRLLRTDLNTELAIQITIKSSCYFVFNHYVLHCPNLYSTNLHNSLTAPNWTAVCRCIHIILTELWSDTSYRLSLYRLLTDPTENTAWTVEEACLPLGCLAIDVISLLLCVAGVMFTGPLPSNEL
jgi:hypothetical protein